MDTSDKKFRNSRFLHLFSQDGHKPVYCLYHSLTQRKIYGGGILKALYEMFDSPRQVVEVSRQLCEYYSFHTLAQVIGALRERRMIVPEGDTNLQTYVRLFHAGTQRPPIRHMYLIPAAGCNFRCAYCFVEDESRGYPTGRMTLDTARESIEVFAKLSERADRITLAFYGGEPLLNASVVYESMRYVRELETQGAFKLPVEMSLVTNGARVDESTVQAILETKTKVSVSIDGPRDLHDAARVDTSNKGTFDRAVKGFRMLQEAGVNPGVSCTLTRHNINEMEQVVGFIAEELNPSGVGLNILLPTIRSGNPLDVSHDHVAQQLIVAFKSLRKYGMYEDRTMRRFAPFKHQDFHFKDCLAVGGQIVVTPGGKIGPCQAFLGFDEYFPLTVDALHKRLPEIDSDEIYGNSMFRDWCYRLPLNMQECADCFAIAVCGGGCPYAAQVNHGSIWKIDERICFEAKAVLEWLIWDTYQDMVEDGPSDAAVIL